MERRSFLLGLGALPLVQGVAWSADAVPGPATPIGLETLLSIVGRPGGTSWVQSFAHVLELPPGQAPRVAFAELAVIECRIREATVPEAAGADMGGGRLFRVDVRGAAQPLLSGTHLPMREYRASGTGRVSPVAPSRWSSATLLSESSWLDLDARAARPLPRAPARVARAGDEWYVFHETVAGGHDAGTGEAVVESTGWRVRPDEIGRSPLGAGYNHVALLTAAARPWLGEDPARGVQWLANATGRKVLDRAGLAPAARELLGQGAP